MLFFKNLDISSLQEVTLCFLGARLLVGALILSPLVRMGAYAAAILDLLAGYYVFFLPGSVSLLGISDFFSLTRINISNGTFIIVMAALVLAWLTEIKQELNKRAFLADWPS